MSSPPEPASSSTAYAGVWRLNGIVWGLLLLLALAAFGWGAYGGLAAFLLLPVVAGVGMVANLGLFFSNAVCYRFRQAVLYGLSFALLAVAFFWLRDFVGNNIPGKIGG
ncbi:hypothetical protein [Hymenobacter properus]|uniref:Uncharacterized protein n=1 Tax=Hymenobacter properus TaxID=2791026 RepID=A0A931BKX9_9BACT|nr:hypothetical protein [Hymenobacter properus]MBF9143242.1 hypothetical protein [Hymenobacter properus]MBR7722052.1 hypothetical protein [Microvirga sp. SRT04]